MGDREDRALSLAEQILLLLLDEETSELRGVPPAALAQALAGAVLFDLALANRVDTDLRELSVVNPRPTGDPLQDRVLATIARAPRVLPTRHWLGALAGEASSIRDEALAGLVAKGVVLRDETRVMWVFPRRRFPVVNEGERTDVRRRVRELVLGDELPDPRDAVLVTLVETCRLFPEILSPEELARARGRIAALSRLELIGTEISRVLRDIEHELAQALAHLG